MRAATITPPAAATDTLTDKLNPSGGNTVTTPNPYPGYYQASDGNWYPVAAQTPPAPPAPAAPPAPPEPVAARGTLDDFDDQPSAGGGSATSKYFTPVRVQTEHWLQLQISRDLNHNDVRQQRDKNGNLLTFKSTGKPKWELLVPTTLLSASDPAGAAAALPEGKVTAFIKGLSHDALKAAMSAAGIADPGAAIKRGKLGGASFYMMAKGTRQYGNNTANVFEFIYTPNGREEQVTPGVAVTPGPEAAIPPTAPPAAETTASAPAAPAPPPSTPPAPAVSAPPPPAAPTAAPAPPPPAAGVPPATTAPAPPPPAAPAPPVDAKKAALLQQLQGQAQ